MDRCWCVICKWSRHSSGSKLSAPRMTDFIHVQQRQETWWKCFVRLNLKLDRTFFACYNYFCSQLTLPFMLPIRSHQHALSKASLNTVIPFLRLCASVFVFFRETLEALCSAMALHWESPQIEEKLWRERAWSLLQQTWEYYCHKPIANQSSWIKEKVLQFASSFIFKLFILHKSFFVVVLVFLSLSRHSNLQFIHSSTKKDLHYPTHTTEQSPVISSSTMLFLCNGISLLANTSEEWC